MNIIPAHDQLGRLSDEQLIARYNENANSTLDSANFYLDELARRQLLRQNKQMLALTVTITVLTIVNVVLVAVAVLES